MVIIIIINICNKILFNKSIIYFYRYFEDKLLVADKSHVKINAVEDVHTLLISNLTREDSGKYKCEISNESGKNSCDGNLFVKCPPIFETSLTDTKAVEGDTDVEFTVKLNSYPKATVKW